MRRSILCAAVLVTATSVAIAEPCKSGLQPGERPGPYAAVVSVGPQRGQSHCFICETGDQPAVVVFARRPTDALGQLLVRLDKALAVPKTPLRGWVTFLSDDQPALDPVIVDWSRKHGLRHLPIGIFEDEVGPPSYKLAAEADVTVLMFVQQKVVANFAFRAGELTPQATDAIVQALPRILDKP
ncbi:MAG: hypothetical protein NZ700_13495 [Gemmataceae bacterium]|nr:hypothetical protein [Gemmataceae bacterium]MDW8265333.1 hypothetical protein [Gemmataceae bacterium]